MSQSEIERNVTSNYEEPHNEKLPNVIEAEIFISFEILIAIFAFTNNFLVLVALRRYPTLRNPTNYFVASLAVADIAVAVFAIPSAILLRLGLSVHHSDCDVIDGPSVSEGLCLVIVTSVLFLTQVSIYSLLLIAIDRFIAIHYPYRYSRFMTVTKTKLAIVSALILSGLTVIPAPSWSQWSELSPCERNKCRFEEIVSKQYMVYVNFFGCVLLPLVAMCIMYFSIFWSARKQLAKIYYDVAKSRKRQKRHRRKASNTMQISNKSSISPPCGIETSKEFHDAVSTSKRNSQISITPATQFSMAATATIVTAITKSPDIIRQLSTVQCTAEEERRQRAKMKRKRALLRRELHAAKSLATVVGVFALCWLPIHILHAVSLFCKNYNEPYILLDVTILLSHANSLINPIIYAHRLGDFRHAFRKIFAPISKKLSKNISMEDGFGLKFCPCLQEPSPNSTPEFSNDDIYSPSPSEPFIPTRDNRIATFECSGSTVQGTIT